MKKIFNFKSIRTKMVFGFSIVLLLVVLLGIYNFMIMKNVNDTTEDVLHEDLPALIADEILAYNMVDSVSAAYGYLLFDDVSYKERFDKLAEDDERQVSMMLELDASDKFIGLVEETEAWREYIVNEVFKPHDQGNHDLAVENIALAIDGVNGIIAGYEEMVAAREASIIELEESVLARGQTTLIVGVTVSLLVVIAGLVTTFFSSRSISRPLGIVMERMNLIASGDLSAEPLETSLRDEIGALVTATNEMHLNTRDVMNQINTVSETVTSQSEELHQSADEVRAGSEQIAVTMEELARGASEQANTASDLSTVMVSFTGKVEEVNQNSDHIQRSSGEVLTMTQEGSRLMEDSTKQMGVIDGIVHEAVDRVEGLDTHAQEISELVSVIQDIAAQTNLLALNAAIEAARAGEHGQGFAVVADEVRKLAEQSSASVTNITGIVDRIQSESSSVVASLRNGYEDVEAGTSQVIATGKMFSNITDSVTDMVHNIGMISDNIADIAANSQEMSGSIEEVAAISEQSAAGVEETTASSEQSSSIMEEVTGSSKQLASLSEELNGLVLRFKL